MKRKIIEKIKAIELRKRGYSVNEIVKNIGVSKSSISTWVRNVVLSEQSRKRRSTKRKSTSKKRNSVARDFKKLCKKYNLKV
jgi:transposase